jgi:hypothetical protein
MDGVAWTMFAIGLAMVAISIYVIVIPILGTDPTPSLEAVNAAAANVKPVLYLGGLFTLASIGAKTGVLETLKSLFGG